LFLMNVGRSTDAIRYEERAMHAEPLLLRPVTLRAALYEMSGELDKAEAMLSASNDLTGQEAMRRQGLIMISLARHDRSGAMRLGDQALALNALRALAPSTQILFTIWRPALSDVRRRADFEQVVRNVGLVDYWGSSGDWGDFCRETAGGGFSCR
jgi:hypothetical protein